jgi:hypothetical protein
VVVSTRSTQEEEEMKRTRSAMLADVEVQIIGQVCWRGGSTGGT